MEWMRPKSVGLASRGHRDASGVLSWIMVERRALSCKAAVVNERLRSGNAEFAVDVNCACRRATSLGGRLTVLGMPY